MLKIIKIIMTCMLMVSCSSTNYTPKQPIQVPQHWHHKDPHFVTKKQNTACFAWWKQFNDPVFDALIAQSLSSNNELQVAMANIEAAQGELKRVELNWIPSAGTMLGYSSFPYLGYPGVLAAVVPTYTINLISQYYEQKRAKYELSATESVRDSVKLAVIAEVSANYFSYLAQRDKLSLLTQIEADEEKRIAIYQAAFHDGLFNDIDVEKLKSKLDLMRSEEKILRNSLVVHQNAIRFLLNDNPGSLVNKGQYSQLNNQHLVVGALPLNVIENRPDVRQANEALRASNAGVNIAVSGFLPTIQLSMARGDIATVPNGRKLGQPVYFNQALLQTPLVTLSTFGEVDKAKGLNKASYFHYQNTLRQALREVDDDLSAHDYFSERFFHTQKAEAHFYEVYRLNQSLYQKGVISYATLLEEKIKLYTLKMKLNQRKLDQLLSVVHLYQDLAVGYGCSNTP